MSFRSQRVKAGLSVLEVAKRLSVSDAAVYFWETKTTIPTGKRLIEIAKLYNCSVDDLLKEDDTDVEEKG